MKRLRALGLAALLVALGTCGGPDLPTTGWLQVLLSSPNTDDGGVLFIVSGGPIDSVRSSYADFFAARQGGSWRMLVAGGLAPGVVAEVWVPDLGAVATYTGTVEQVAQRTTYAQRPTSAYRVSIERLSAP